MRRKEEGSVTKSRNKRKNKKELKGGGKDLNKIYDYFKLMGKINDTVNIILFILCFILAFFLIKGYEVGLAITGIGIFIFLIFGKKIVGWFV